jgi:hypothetical protein
LSEAYPPVAGGSEPELVPEGGAAGFTGARALGPLPGAGRFEGKGLGLGFGAGVGLEGLEAGFLIAAVLTATGFGGGCLWDVLAAITGAATPPNINMAKKTLAEDSIKWWNRLFAHINSSFCLMISVFTFVSSRH